MTNFLTDMQDDKDDTDENRQTYRHRLYISRMGLCDRKTTVPNIDYVTVNILCEKNWKDLDGQNYVML